MELDRFEGKWKKRIRGREREGDKERKGIKEVKGDETGRDRLWRKR